MEDIINVAMMVEEADEDVVHSKLEESDEFSPSFPAELELAPVGGQSVDIWYLDLGGETHRIGVSRSLFLSRTNSVCVDGHILAAYKGDQVSVNNAPEILHEYNISLIRRPSCTSGLEISFTIHDTEIIIAPKPFPLLFPCCQCPPALPRPYTIFVNGFDVQSGISRTHLSSSTVATCVSWSMYLLSCLYCWHAGGSCRSSGTTKRYMVREIVEEEGNTASIFLATELDIDSLNNNWQRYSRRPLLSTN